ncbi:MAG: leucyl-tRNA synthetase [Myxococcales bacterium]|nr:leucyl-tRNA synthetase [Myxococcales bacterium]
MSSEKEDRYDPRAIEPKWQETWKRAGVFRAVRDPAKKKFFIMEMFPYPSGRLHMGHVRNYTIGDVVARVHRMRGEAVLYPMGWDAFGLPAENAAIKAKVHPRAWTLQNIGHMREQFVLLGLSYDWDREVTTCEPEYFVHEQRIFIEMFKKGLAYRKAAVVNWCPVDQTVLANEQVEDGLCWRCRSVVQQRELEQWFLKVTAYADELLADMGKLKWAEKVLKMQENWIGRSEGARIEFPMKDGGIEVFTTRPDTLYGVTFMSIAAEHPLMQRATAEAKAFAAEVSKEDKIKRGAEDYEKRGVDTGLRCTHPLTGAELPVYVANFVLMDYGTGAVMAVPAHDQRDFEFATRYGLDKRVVIQPDGEPPLDVATMKEAYSGPGKLVHSGEFDGLDNESAKAKITARAGQPTVTYRLRDWLLSRQRYWGCPIPMVKCAEHGYLPVPDAELPVRLPDDVTLAEGGRSPLAAHPTWSKATCPTCGGPATRETDTMDGFMESSWYELRYCSPHTAQWLDPKEVEYWMPVDQYIGGVEHATKHLIYARFFTKMLRDWNWIPKNIDEPYTSLLNQGMVVKETFRCPDHDYLYPEEVKDGACAHCGKPVVIGRTEKMSKSLKNVVEPLPLIEKYGADTVRIFSLFAAPPDSLLEWNDAGVEGAWRFLNRVNRMVEKHATAGFAERGSDEVRQKTHATIKRVTEDVESFKFNTAIAAIMELVNVIYAATAVDRDAVEAVVRLLGPMAPHLAEEMWRRLGHPEAEMLVTHPWPTYDPAVAAKKQVVYPVQVNGKLRGQVETDPEAAREAVESQARGLSTVKPWIEGKEVVKVVFVPGRLINFVVRA